MYFAPLELRVWLDFGCVRGGIGEIPLKGKISKDFSALGIQIGPFTDC